MEIVLLTHGEWGAELVKSAELIVGPLKNVKCFPLHPDCPLKEYVRETQAYIEQRKEEEFLLITDIRGGSTFYTAGLLSRTEKIRAVSGLSMDMLILADELRQEYSVREIIPPLIEGTKNKITDMETVLGKE